MISGNFHDPEEQKKQNEVVEQEATALVPTLRREDAEVLSKIIYRPWEALGETLKVKVIKKLEQLALDDNVGRPTQMRALKLLIDAEKLNMLYALSQKGHISARYLPFDRNDKHDCRRTLTVEQQRDLLLAVLARTSIAPGAPGISGQAADGAAG